MDQAANSKASLTRAQATADIAIYVAAASLLYAAEALLRGAGIIAWPPAFDGVLAVVLAFFVVVALMKWRGQTWVAFGLKKPARWWTIPAWAFVILVVNVIAQNTLVPALAVWLELEPPDFSRYDVVRDNLPMLLVIASGAMITGGFMEEVVYRGMMIDRFGVIFGGGRRGLLLAALLNGLPFGIIHFEWGLGGIAMTTVMGSVLGLMYLATGRNLWPLIVAHATLDATLLTLLYFGKTV